jgi:anti-anti-sigma factor
MAKSDTLKVRCPKCRKVLAVKAELAGKKGRCPLCGQAMTIPRPPAGARGSKTVPGLKWSEKEAPPTARGKTVTLRAPTKKELEETAGPAGKPPAPAPPPGPPPAPAAEGAPQASGLPPAPEAVEEEPELLPPPEPAPSSEPAAPARAPKARPRPEPSRRAARPTEASYLIEGGTLRVPGRLGYELDPDFQKRCTELSESGEKDLTVDLGKVSYLSSSHLGVLAELMTGAREGGRTVTLRVTAKVSRILRLAGLELLGTVEVVD